MLRIENEDQNYCILVEQADLCEHQIWMIWQSLDVEQSDLEMSLY